MSRKTRIGLFGGSFNPPHNGHVEICNTILKEKWVDAIWVIPCWKHPFQKNMVSFEERMEMCRLAFQSFGEDVAVKDVEKKLGGTSYTLRTVEHLQKQYAENDFFLILGKDAADESRVWHGVETLKVIIQWLIIPRGPLSPIPDVSASYVRKELAAGRALDDVLPVSVFQYITTHRLYEEKI